MKNVTRFKKLLKELSRDPRLKRVLAKSTRRSRQKRLNQIEALADMFLILSTIASGFLKKKKARVLDEQADMVYFLVQLSLLLKENVFDRPEVQEFFSRSGRQIQLMTRESLSAIKPKNKRPRSRAH